MEGVLVEIISQFGVLGLILAGIVYLIYEGFKTKKNQASCSTKIDESIRNLKSHVDTRIDDINVRIDDVNCRVDDVNDKVNSQYDILTKKIDKNPEVFIKKFEEKQTENNKEHMNKVMAQFDQAPKLHKVLKLYRERINCDHIFLGTFHNGSTTISGIPYCKFDIIAEKFKPGYNSLDNVELTSVYKDSDIMVHDCLPLIISQEDHIYYKIDENGKSELEEVDDILYRRLIKRGVKQLAANLIRDAEMNPIGVVGCIDFGYDELNFKELNNCAHELEEIYK